MEENKNQTSAASAVPASPIGSVQDASAQGQRAHAGIFVKDYDGKLKVFADGVLRELDEYMATAEAPASGRLTAGAATTSLDFPKFTDLAPIAPDEHFVEPRQAPVKPEAKADMHFHPSDQEDVEREFAKVNSIFQLGQQKKYSVMRIAEKLAEKHGLSLTPEDFRVFTKILLSNFRSSRSFVQTRAMLVAPRVQAGLELNGDTADHILKVVRYLKEKIESVDGIVVEQESEDQEPAATAAVKSEPEIAGSDIRGEVGVAASGSRSEGDTDTRADQHLNAAADVSSASAMAVADISQASGTGTAEVQSESMPMQVQESPAAASVQDSRQELKPANSEATQEAQAQKPRVSWRPVIPGSVSQSLPEYPMPGNTDTAGADRTVKPPAPLPDETVKKDYASVAAVHEEIPKVVRPAASTRPGPVIQDVRAAVKPPQTRLIGPIEELAAMDLQTWRLLDEDPRVRAGKILGRIQNLEQQSLLRKHQGIDAWRSGEVYQYYLALGQRSLEQQKDIAEVIAALQAENRETLSVDEFEAVSDLSRMLRY